MNDETTPHFSSIGKEKFVILKLSTGDPGSGPMEWVGTYVEHGEAMDALFDAEAEAKAADEECLLCVIPLTAMISTFA